MLSPDENEILGIGLLPDKTAIVTGVLGDGSCFVHSLLLSLSPIEYLTLDEDLRKDYVKEVRSILADNLSTKVWVNQDSFTVALITYISNFLQKLMVGKPVRNIKIKEVMKVNPTFKKLSNEDIDKIVAIIQKDTKDLGKVKGILGDSLGNKKLADVLVDEIIKVTHEKAVANIRNTLEYIEDWNFKYVSDSLGVMPIFINKHDGTLYNYGISREYYQSVKKVVLVAYIDEAHFESIGIIDGDVIRRTFNPKDPLISGLIKAIESTL